jgi:hypothetical protein
MPQSCVVFVPHKFGGHHSYDVSASSSFDAAWQAIRDHERTHKIVLPDDLVLQVVVDGKNGNLYGCDEHNATKQNFWVRVGRIRGDKI